MKFKTEQEEFWAGSFGNEYINRNQGEALLASNLSLFANALRTTRSIKSGIEFGANIGMNIRAIKKLFPAVQFKAIEINSDAVKKLEDILPQEQINHCSILDFTPEEASDLVLIKGVLIHINPSELPKVYDKLVSSCGKYLLVIEYYNPSPVSIPYRGHADKLFKRDFAGEIMDRYPEMQLVDYGFVYRRDPNFPQDDCTWFLLEKKLTGN